MTRYDPGDRFRTYCFSYSPCDIRLSKTSCQRAVCDRLGAFKFEKSPPDLHLEVGAAHRERQGYIFVTPDGVDQSRSPCVVADELRPGPLFAQLFEFLSGTRRVDEREATQATRRFGKKCRAEGRGCDAMTYEHAGTFRADLAGRHRLERDRQIVQSSAARESDGMCCVHHRGLVA